MKVKQLRKLLRKMPGEMSVCNVAGNDIASAEHIWRINLVTMEQFCELRTYFEEHTPQGENIYIERNTGFKSQEELVEAYNALKES